jgi:transposase-like protein
MVSAEWYLGMLLHSACSLLKDHAHCNGHGAKTVLTPEGSMELSVPRDRHGRFDLTLIGK